MPSRRHLLQAALAAAATAPFARLSLAAGAGNPASDGGRRFVFVVLRGGMDGLTAVPAIGDPAFAAAQLSQPLHSSCTA